jgi:hypothetical protein
MHFSGRSDYPFNLGDEPLIAEDQALLPEFMLLNPGDSQRIPELSQPAPRRAAASQF